MTETALYTRPKYLLDVPMFYCPGCGHAIIHRLIAELIEEMHLGDEAVGIAPVGCAVTAYNYLDFDFIEAAHGRAPAVATGIKRARSDLFVFAYQGDGDLASIGTAEIIHAANRGENYTTIFVNNTIYGMTGGQLAPTTLAWQKTSTCPNGRDPATMGHPIRVCESPGPCSTGRPASARPRPCSAGPSNPRSTGRGSAWSRSSPRAPYTCGWTPRGRWTTSGRPSASTFP
ncbi:hypothetical protein LCGC14_2272500 [marine sediment metagenome]|uniref:Thiamine pyrophosphate enzyme TPP-binding domain-containing protein n=1 Tax=marine sediment metagenome TaxID=412755 RepID=A0A0F9FRR3_9ZZZZ